MKSNIKYSKLYKEAVLALNRDLGMPIKKIAHQEGLPPRTIYCWRDQAKK